MVAKESIRQLQIASGLWIPHKLRAPKIQPPRARRACLGELIQIDGCEHRRFEDRAPMCTALVYVDDATSRLMLVRFMTTESTFSYFEATRALTAHLLLRVGALDVEKLASGVKARIGTPVTGSSTHKSANALGKSPTDTTTRVGPSTFLRRAECRMTC